MINLLPEATKAELGAARLNVILFRYIIILSLGIVFLGGIVAGSFVILGNIRSSAETTIQSNNAKATSFGSTQVEADTLKANLSSAKTILDADIDYTSVITGIAALVPSGVVLDKLSINPTVFGTPTTIQAYAKTTEDAVALKDAFQASPLFSAVSFNSLSNTTGADAYPVNAQLTVTLNKVSAQ